MKLLTAVTLHLTFSLAASIYCATGYYDYYTLEAEFSYTYCDQDVPSCQSFDYNDKSGYNTILMCGNCAEDEKMSCVACSYDMCNILELRLSGAEYLPTTMSLMFIVTHILVQIV